MRRLRIHYLAASLPYLGGRKVQRYVREFQADWALGGRSPRTAATYVQVLRPLLISIANDEDVTLASVKEWVAEHPSAQSRRLRARAARAWFSWCAREEILDASWWAKIPLATVPETPQATVVEDEYRAALARAANPRDKALVAVLWSSGMRREELTRMRVEHLDLDGGHVIVPVSKTGRHRVAPLSPEAVRLLGRYLRKHPSQQKGAGPLWLGQRGPLGVDGIRSVLRTLGAPTAHAWRRGWAVDALRNGVPQTSVQAAAGWSNGAMVSRYTRALASDLAIQNFAKRWAAS